MLARLGAVEHCQCGTKRVSTPVGDAGDHRVIGSCRAGNLLAMSDTHVDKGLEPSHAHLVATVAYPGRRHACRGCSQKELIKWFHKRRHVPGGHGVILSVLGAPSSLQGNEMIQFVLLQKGRRTFAGCKQLQLHLLCHIAGIERRPKHHLVHLVCDEGGLLAKRHERAGQRHDARRPVCLGVRRIWKTGKACDEANMSRRGKGLSGEHELVNKAERRHTALARIMSNHTLHVAKAGDGRIVVGAILGATERLQAVELDVGDEHVARCVCDAKRQLGALHCHERCDATGPKAGDIAVLQSDGVAKVGRGEIGNAQVGGGAAVDRRTVGLEKRCSRCKGRVHQICWYWAQRDDEVAAKGPCWHAGAVCAVHGDVALLLNVADRDACSEEGLFKAETAAQVKRGQRAVPEIGDVGDLGRAHAVLPDVVSRHVGRNVRCRSEWRSVACTGFAAVEQWTRTSVLAAKGLKGIRMLLVQDDNVGLQQSPAQTACGATQGPLGNLAPCGSCKSSETGHCVGAAAELLSAEGAGAATLHKGKVALSLARLCWYGPVSVAQQSSVQTPLAMQCTRVHFRRSSGHERN
eukprot:m.189965 g.189965  ORF g.189965 m.189965 type:complete len:578 (+) comp10574_c0_seq4:276-2009(+)